MKLGKRRTEETAGEKDRELDFPASSTVYDDVFRSVMTYCPDLILPVCNEIFGTEFVRGREGIISAQNEFFFTNEKEGKKKIISDSHLLINRRPFHIECQSTADGTMAVRMFEYDIQIGMVHAGLEGSRYHVRLPDSAVLFLRSTPGTPDHYEIRVETADGDSCIQRVPVLKLSGYGIGEIMEKELYFLVPFLIFNYEKDLDACEKDERSLERLTEKFASVREYLDRMHEGGKISSFTAHVLYNSTGRVVNRLAGDRKKTAERLGGIMNGKLLKYQAIEILDEGKKKARLKGEKKAFRRPRRRLS